MPQSSEQTVHFLKGLKHDLHIHDFHEKLRSENETVPLPKRIPAGNDFTEAGLEKRRDVLRDAACCPEALCHTIEGLTPADMKGAVENFIGYTHLPVGVIGPLRITGLFANGDFYVPLATTEGALVASYHRGAHAVSRNGGVTSLCISESISRAPAFSFSSIVEAGLFIDWALTQRDKFKELAGETTRHGKLVDLRPSLNSNTAFLIFEYETADAAGQNMVTVATEHICRWIAEASPVQPKAWYVEGNLSGDKKATMLSFLSHRGRKVVAESTLKKKDVERFLHSTPEAMAEYSRVSTIGGIQSGSIGVQGHYANALAAIFLCCGQDVACLSETSVGITTMQVDDNGDLYVSVSLPNLTVGTVGGGTFLPGAQDCLKMLGCDGNGHARKFAEICAATVLAGEVSIIAALASGDFAQAHTTYRHKSE
ncbi:hydroxymethylglutaryl-CoA reductase [Pontiellaceae bacterium B1224]|nr:hydroxymethylglutaryl-CoA reductase [Pontiellaceae bacterium B1224]